MLAPTKQGKGEAALSCQPAASPSLPVPHLSSPRPHFLDGTSSRQEPQGHPPSLSSGNKHTALRPCSLRHCQRARVLQVPQAIHAIEVLAHRQRHARHALGNDGRQPRLVTRPFSPLEPLVLGLASASWLVFLVTSAGPLDRVDRLGKFALAPVIGVSGAAAFMAAGLPSKKRSGAR